MAESTQDAARPDDDFGIQAVRELVQLLAQTDIAEIQIERGTSRLLIRRGHTSNNHTGVVHHVQTVPTPVATPAQPAQAPSSEFDHLLPGQSCITAPMVGTFYAAPSPKDRPYVEEGDIIQPGDRVGIIEAMKMMNEIESEVSGRIVRLMVKNGQPVEYGQPLLIVEPI